MLYVLPETTGDIIVLQANGTLTNEDYETVFKPLFEHVKNTHPEVRLLITFAPDCDSIEPDCLWQADRFGEHHSTDFYRVAVVGQDKWLTWLDAVKAELQQGDIRYYRMTQLLDAFRWINDEDEDDDNEPLYPFSAY